MSLVVAAIHDDCVTLVADTKVTDDQDPTSTLRTFNNALPKIVIMSPNLAVGVTGNGPHALLELLVELRDEPLDRLSEHLTEVPAAEFVIATHEPAGLWSIRYGECEERTAIKRAWAGSHAAYERFQAGFHQWASTQSVPFRMMASMQLLTSFGADGTVGGHTVRVTTGHAGFRFVADAVQVAPAFLEGVLALRGKGGKLRISTPDGVDPTMYSAYQLPGTDPTPGALAIFIPEAGIGILFPQERPWDPEQIHASSVSDFAAKAVASGQVLSTTGFAING